MSNELQSIDVTKLVEYTRKISDIGSLNKMMAPNYLQDFINAMDATSSMLSKATKANLLAHSYCKRAEAIAYLDRAGDYLSDKGIKDTAESRKKYIDIDPDVTIAREKVAATDAMVVFLKNKYQAFRCAHDDVKKISFSDVQGTAFEGY
jgi:hypothetical protein